MDILNKGEGLDKGTPYPYYYLWCAWSISQLFDYC